MSATVQSVSEHSDSSCTSTSKPHETMVALARGACAPKTSQNAHATDELSSHRNHSQTNTKTGDNAHPVFKLYFIRHFVIFTFAYNTFINAMAQMSFVAIQENSALKYGVSQSSINMFALLYTILFVPGSILCYYMLRKWNLRLSFIFAALTQTLGAFIRFFSVCTSSSTSTFGLSPYFVAVLGTLLPALVQPFYTNSATRIAAEWYSVDGRDAVTAILGITNILGAGFGMILPTAFVKPNSTDGFGPYLLCQALLMLVGLVATVAFHKDKPPTPPSMSQFLKLDSETRAKLIEDNTEYGARVLAAGEEAINNLSDGTSAAAGATTKWQQVKSDLVTVCTNVDFIWLCVGYGGGLGLFIALATLMSQYTAAFHYNSSNAGVFGALTVIGGIIGAVAAGVAMEVLKKFKSILRACVLCALAAILHLVFQMREDNYGMVCFSFALVGMGAIPIVPIAMTCCAETTCPVPEDVGAGVVLVVGHAAAIMFTLIWAAMLPTSGHYYQDANNESTYFLLGVMVAVAIALFMFNGEYKRLNLERQKSSNKSSNVSKVSKVSTPGQDKNPLLPVV